MNSKALKILRSHLVKWGEFDSDRYIFSNLPDDFVQEIDEELKVLGLKRGTINKNFSVAIDAGEYEVQAHDYSVSSHCDEVANGEYFAAIPYATLKRTQAKRLDKGSVLEYTDHRGTKTSSILRKGRMVVFNPQEEHSLTYYGEAVKLMIFTVVKEEM